METETYFEIRTYTGVVIQQLMTVKLLEKWIARRKNFDYQPAYRVYKITKTVEPYDV